MLDQDTAKSLIEDDTYYTMSVLKKGASKGYAPRSLLCCICNCSFTKISSSSGIRLFNCGHATHLQCDVQENGTSGQSSAGGCPICVHKHKIQKTKGKTADQGLVMTTPSRSTRVQATSFLHPHELDAFENSGSHQISRVMRPFPSPLIILLLWFVVQLICNCEMELAHQGILALIPIGALLGSVQQGKGEPMARTQRLWWDALSLSPIRAGCSMWVVSLKFGVSPSSMSPLGSLSLPSVSSRWVTRSGLSYAFRNYMFYSIFGFRKSPSFLSWDLY